MQVMTMTRMSNDISYRQATVADVASMADCRRSDPAAGPADARMAAYFEGTHHPQQALPPRAGFVAEERGRIVGYIAGHQTTRFGCDGEVQYLFVAPDQRERGVASELLRALAAWFQAHGIAKVCVDVDLGSPAATPFYVHHGAVPINRFWYMWTDIGSVLEPARLPDREVASE
jgi:GNAT superfamily N-acetyltransferase